MITSKQREDVRKVLQSIIDEAPPTEEELMRLLETAYDYISDSGPRFKMSGWLEETEAALKKGRESMLERKIKALEIPLPSTTHRS